MRPRTREYFLWPGTPSVTFATCHTATASTSDSAHNSRSIIAPTLSIVTTATISATPSNFSCASAHPCTATERMIILSTSLEWQNDGRARPLGAPRILVKAFPALLGLAWMERTKPIIHQRSNLVPAASAHRDATNTP